MNDKIIMPLFEQLFDMRGNRTEIVISNIEVGFCYVSSTLDTAVLRLSCEGGFYPFQLVPTGYRLNGNKLLGIQEWDGSQMPIPR